MCYVFDSLEENFLLHKGDQDTDKEYMRRKEMADNGYLRPEKFVAWYFGISEEEAKDYLPEAAPPMFGEE